MSTHLFVWAGVSLCNKASFYLVSLGEIIVSATVCLLAKIQTTVTITNHSSSCISTPIPNRWYLPSKHKPRQWHFLLAIACVSSSLQNTSKTQCKCTENGIRKYSGALTPFCYMSCRCHGSDITNVSVIFINPLQVSTKHGNTMTRNSVKTPKRKTPSYHIKVE